MMVDLDLDDDEELDELEARRGCLTRVAPLLCRCLCRARRRPVGQASPPPHNDDAYGDASFNPMANDGLIETRADDGLIARPSVEIVEPRRPFAQAAAPLAAPPPAPPPTPQPPPPPLTADEDPEPAEDYVAGGYHPVALGDVYDERYEVEHKLGWGVYSTVWCCRDRTLQKRVALKIQKAAPEYTASAVTEIEILSHIRRRSLELRRESRVVELLEHFYVAGPHGNHVCMVFELLGRTLLHEIQERGALEVEEVKRCTRCLLECLAFVHEETGILHTDIKPENVLLVGPPPVARVKLVDLGTAFYVQRQGARDIQTREYRCPEGVLGLWPFGPAADVWSVGCLVFELLTGETLFDPQSPRPGEPFSKDESHLAQTVELLGPVPPALIRKSPRAARWFRADGSALKNIAIAPPPLGADAIARVLEENFAFGPRGARDTSDFLRALLRYDPDARVSARRALDLPWLADGGLVL